MQVKTIPPKATLLQRYLTPLTARLRALDILEVETDNDFLFLLFTNTASFSSDSLGIVTSLFLS